VRGNGAHGAFGARTTTIAIVAGCSASIGFLLMNSLKLQLKLVRLLNPALQQISTITTIRKVKFL